MSESFHLTKSPLVRVSLVSLNLRQGLFHMSKHFNDIWCWDVGEGASLKREEDGEATQEPGETGGKVLEGNWMVKEAVEKDVLGESWSTTPLSSSSNSPTVAHCLPREKLHLVRVSLSLLSSKYSLSRSQSFQTAKKSL